MDMRLNRIPVETWNHLNVNQAHEEFDMPELGAGNDRKPSVIPDLPSAVGEGYDSEIISLADIVNNIKVNDGEDNGTLTYRYDKGQIIFDEIDVGADGSVTIIRFLDTVKDNEIYSLTKIRAGRDSSVKLVEVDLCDDRSDVRSGVAILTEERASVEMVRIVLGGKKALFGVRADLKGDDSSFDIDTAYYCNDEMSLDINDISNFYGHETRSFLNTVGALSGRSKKVLRNTVDFKRGCVHAVGHEKEDVVMFSDDAINLTTPLILCGEEWVEGQHAATTTRLDDDILYYLESRGLDEHEAIKLVACSKFAPVIDKIPDQEIRDAVYSELMRRIDADHEDR
jgi:Fe-S cluster assembly scaffold protein SufB